jgi:hypothetical protein
MDSEEIGREAVDGIGAPLGGGDLLTTSGTVSFSNRTVVHGGSSKEYVGTACSKSTSEKSVLLVCDSASQ